MRHGVVRLAVVALAAFTMTCGARANRGSLGAPPPPPAAGPRMFDPEIVRAGEGSPVERVRGALARGDTAEAQRLAVQALPSATDDDAARLRWLAGEAAARSGDHVTAAALFGAVGRAEHPLAPWARVRRAEILLESEPIESAEIASALTTGWAGAEAARSIEARSLARAGRYDEAIPKLRAIVESAPRHVGAATAAMPLAAILAAQGDVAAREESLRLYRRVATRAPLTRAGADALHNAAEVLASLPEDRRAALAALPIDDDVARADALFGAMRHREAEEAFASIAARPDADAERRCHARLLQGRAMFRNRERDRAAQHLRAVAGECTAPDVRAWARYLAGRSLSMRGDLAGAIAEYDALVREVPEHSLADDALFRAAIAAGDAGDAAEMSRRLAEVPVRYPAGDMHADARFALAWRARRDRRFDDALAHLDALIAGGSGEDDEDERGRALYWRARTLGDLGRAAEAAGAYESVVRAWPLSYYAQQAIRRLDEVAPERARAALASMRDVREIEPLLFAWREELEVPAFDRALELLRVGDTSRALEELASMGLPSETADPELLWLAAALLDRAEAHADASRIVRRYLPDAMRTMPRGRLLHLWRIAYPRAFAPLIDDVAREEDVPPAFVRAVAREESAFDPTAVSVANATGLIQLMEPTARRFAAALGLPSDRSALVRPEINVRIGARYIAFLFGRYASNPAVVPAAYNAGEGAADRWLRAKADLPLDEWIEEIPYDETRHYTRRVNQTWGIYAWLERGELPALARDLPRR